MYYTKSEAGCLSGKKGTDGRRLLIFNAISGIVKK